MILFHPGTMQAIVLVMYPPPHSLEHFDQSLQSPSRVKLSLLGVISKMLEEISTYNYQGSLGLPGPRQHQEVLPGVSPSCLEGEGKFLYYAFPL